LANEWYERSDCGRVSCFKEAAVGQVTNHIPLNCIIGAKRILFKVLHWYYTNILEADPFTVLPRTYSFDSDAAASIKAFTEAHKTSKKVWIIKPGENSNRGNGIRIVQTGELMAYLARERSRGP
jgi:tubulin---tyrosine ligase